VHVHTDEPERAMALFEGEGELSRLDVADMRAQASEHAERLAATTPPRQASNGASAARCGVVAVVNGAGLAELFRELGVHTVDGGPTLNPSTFDLLAAIHEVPAEEVLVLPNSANVIMAAERATELSDKDVGVVPTKSQQAGLAAALALVPDKSVEENKRAMTEALARVRTGAVAEAARDDAGGRFRRGEAIGIVEDEVLAWGDPRDALQAVLARLAEGDGGDERPELISVLAGEDAPLAPDAVEQLLGADVELELRSGGQAAYWWLLAAE
jgi:dihydroxyacetone kinase-like predicted kinase